MSLIASFDIPVGSLVLTVPAGTRKVPPVMWDAGLFTAFLDDQGYHHAAREQMERLDAWLRLPEPVDLTWPGEKVDRAPITENSPWYVVCVAARQERFFREALEEKGLTAYFPVHVSRPLKAKRKATRTRPHIPGYVFTCIPDEEALDIVRGVRGFRSIMCQDGKPRRVPNSHLGHLIFAEACHAFDETWVPPKPKGQRYSHAWKKGDRVKIDDNGPFNGWVGTVVRGDNRSRMTIELMLFGRASEVKVEHKDLVKP